VEDIMSIKSLVSGALAAGALALVGATSMTAPAEAKTRIYLGIGHGYYGCVNPGYIDWCGLDAYRVYHRPYISPRSRFYFDEPRFVAGGECRAAARAIRANGYRNIRALDCRGRHFMFRATRKGKTYHLKVDTATGRISRVRT
jgi:hypothetical protein